MRAAAEWVRTLVVRASDNQADEEVPGEADAHCENEKSVLELRRWTRLCIRELTRVATTDAVDEPRADEDAGEGDSAEEELPLCRVAEERLALGVDDRRDDGPGEYAVRESDEIYAMNRA
jgi:hypothetical protein